jgi:hypothetical protein
VERYRDNLKAEFIGVSILSNPNLSKSQLSDYGIDMLGGHVHKVKELFQLDPDLAATMMAMTTASAPRSRQDGQVTATARAPCSRQDGQVTATARARVPPTSEAGEISEWVYVWLREQRALLGIPERK